MDVFILIIIILLCLFLEGFFSGSELALVAADAMRLKVKGEQGDKGASAAISLLKNPRWLFSTTLLGTNICVVTASTVLTYFLISNHGEDYAPFALLLSPVILIFGEVLPKSVYQAHADFFAKKVGIILLGVSYVLFPLVWLFSRLTKLLLGGVEKAAGHEPRLSREELALVLGASESASDIPPEERKMVRRVLELAGAEVKNIMVPLVSVEMLPVSADTEAALAVFDLKGYSRLPLFEHRSHNIVGIVDAADCLFSQERKNLSDLMEEVIYVPETMPLYELYETLQKSGKGVAVVVDEYGGAVGIVTLEDLLEEIVGEIRDEYELGEQQYKVIDEGRYFVSGRMEVEKANEKLKLSIPAGNYETVAGYLLELFGCIPKAGERISDGSSEYIVRRATARAVLEIEVIKR